MNGADQRKKIALRAQAREALAADPTAKIVCPNCGLGVLEVDDRPIWKQSRIERWLRCDYCRAANTIILSPPDDLKTQDAEISRTSDDNIDWNDENAVQKVVEEAAEDIFGKLIRSVPTQK